MKTIYISIFSFLISGSVLYSNNNPDPAKAVNLDVLEVPWIKNQGQFDDQVAYQAKTFAGTIQISKEGDLSYHVINENDAFLHIKEHFNFSNPTTIKTGSRATTTFNYLKGPSSQHHTNIPGFKTIYFEEAWTNISLRIDASQGNVEKFFTIHPGGDPSNIEMDIGGITDICIKKDGELQLDVADQSISFTQPFAWQWIEGKKDTVPVQYRISRNTKGFRYGFNLPEYDTHFPVYIDPLLASTYFGGSGSDEVYKILVDDMDRVYVVGKTKSTDLPITPGAYDDSYNAANTEYDVYIARFSPGLDQLESCTYIGGNDDDHPLDAALDKNGNVFICGYTYSKNYPSTPGAWNPNHEGKNYYNRNAFISKLNPDLSGLLASTFISDEDGSTASSMVIDHLNKVIIAGTADNPIDEVGPQIQNECEGTILIKFNNNLSTAEATNSIGKDGGSIGPPALTIDQNGDILGVNSLLYENHFFVTTTGCYQSDKMGGDEAYIFKMNSNISTCKAASYYGGFHNDECHGIITDQFNNVFICGITQSNDLPVTPGSYDQTGPEVINNQLRSDGFIAKFNTNLTDLQSATFLGIENFDDVLNSILTNDENLPVLFGRLGEGMEVTCNSFQLTGPGNYIVRMNTTLSEIQASTYLRGYSGYDIPSTLTMDHSGNILVAGRTNSSDFPTLNAYDDTKNEGNDVFISKISPDLTHDLPCCTWINDPSQDEIEVLPNTWLSWDYSVNAMGYYLTVGTEYDKTGILNQMDVGNIEEYYIAGLPCDEKIYVRIDAYNAHGIANGQDCTTTSFFTAPPVFTEFFDTICEGDILYWQGLPLFYEGRFRRLYLAANGCDSILQMNLTVNPSFYDLMTDTICAGDSLWWLGNYYRESGIYTETKEAASGCDSLFELHLEVKPIGVAEKYHSICEGDSYSWEGMELSEEGEYSVHFTGSSGCDSIERLFLDLNPTYQFLETQSLCEGSVLVWQGQTLVESGSYHADYQTINGCDSIYALDLLVHPEYKFFEDITICDGEQLSWQGNTYEEAGMYVVMFETIHQCDSTYYLDLAIAPHFAFEEQWTLCPDDTLTWQGIELTTPGEYEALNQSTYGCDSNYYLTLTDIDINVSISSDGETLSAVEQENAHYQWLKCPDWTIIDGATEPVYVTEESGSFAVQITIGSCSLISDCLDIIHSGNENINHTNWTIYPNPNLTGWLQCSIPETGERYQLQILDLNGQKVLEMYFEASPGLLNLDKIESGVYLAVLKMGQRSSSKKFIVLK